MDEELQNLARDVDRKCRLTGTFELRSGITATEYFDKYLFETDPALLRRIVERMVPLIPDQTEVLGGLEMGAFLVTMLSQATGLLQSLSGKKRRITGRANWRRASTSRGRSSPWSRM